MKKIILILAIFLLSSSLKANYKFIERINFSLPRCEIENSEVITKEKCWGKIDYENGVFDYYFGEFLNGVYHGNGILEWTEGVMYFGNFHEGTMEGYGKFKYTKGNRWYVGNWKNNLRSGNAVERNSKMQKYIGEFKNNKKNGKGNYLNYDGNAIETHWVDDKENKNLRKKIDFREYDSGIGIKFNHIGHLGILNEYQIEEYRETLSEDLKDKEKLRPVVEKVRFWDTNYYNNLEIFNTPTYRLAIEYDWFELDKELKEIIANSNSFIDSEKKYPYFWIDHTQEEVMSYMIFIKVGKRYYTIEYMAPYKNEDEKSVEISNFFYFFDSIKFSVPE